MTLLGTDRPGDLFQNPDGSAMTVTEAVGVALGAASTCWENVEAAGVFDSVRCGELFDRLMMHLAGLVTTDASLLEWQVRASAEAMRVEPSGEPGPEHGMAGGAKWRLPGGDPERPDWEGGYLCHCGKVFVRRFADGGIDAAWSALVEHQGGQVVATI